MTEFDTMDIQTERCYKLLEAIVSQSFVDMHNYWKAIKGFDEKIRPNPINTEFERNVLSNKSEAEHDNLWTIKKSKQYMKLWNYFEKADYKEINGIKFRWYD